MGTDLSPEQQLEVEGQLNLRRTAETIKTLVKSGTVGRTSYLTFTYSGRYDLKGINRFTVGSFLGSRSVGSGSPSTTSPLNLNSSSLPFDLPFTRSASTF